MVISKFGILLKLYLNKTTGKLYTKEKWGRSHNVSNETHLPIPTLVSDTWDNK